MVRLLKILGPIVLLAGGYGAKGATPPAAGARSIVPPSLPASTTTGQAASPDGKAHVTMNVSLNLTKLNPLATRAQIICYGAVDDWQAMSTKISNVSSQAPTATIPAGAPSNYVPPELFFPLSIIYPNAQMQVVPFALTNGSYQGTQAVNFTFTPDQLVGLPLPAFMGLCELQIGDSSAWSQAVMDTSGNVQLPSLTNLAFVMTGQVALIAFAQVQFAPL
jgi:hypothetical protein